MASDADREAALAELTRLGEETGSYWMDPPVCHCGRVCCRHHEAD